MFHRDQGDQGEQKADIPLGKFIRDSPWYTVLGQVKWRGVDMKWTRDDGFALGKDAEP
jgi:hypothetical protein